MRRSVYRSLEFAASAAVACAIVFYAVASWSTSRFTQINREDRAHDGVGYARVAALLWPSQLNKLHYAGALQAGGTPEEHRKALALLPGVDWDNPQLPSSAYWVGASLEGPRDNAKAADILQRGLSRYPQDANLWWSLAQVRGHQKQWTQALEAQGNALQFASLSRFSDQDVRRVHADRISNAYSLGDWKKAMRAASESAAAYPADSFWIGCYASFAENAGEYPEAVRAWQRFFAVSKSQPIGRIYDLCRVYGKMRRPASGETFLRKASLSPYALHYCRAALYCYADPVRARKELLRAAEHATSKSQKSKARLLLAASLSWVGKPQESLTQLRKLPEDTAVGSYPGQYACQAEILMNPANVPTELEKGLQWSRQADLPQVTVECEEILSGRQLRMPRFMSPQDATSPPTDGGRSARGEA